MRLQRKQLTKCRHDKTTRLEVSVQLHARHQHEPTLGLPRAWYLGSHLGHLVLDLDLLILELTSVLSLVGELLLLSLDHCFMLLHQLQHLGVTPFGKQTRSTSAQNHLSQDTWYTYRLVCDSVSDDFEESCALSSPSSYSEILRSETVPRCD